MGERDGKDMKREEYILSNMYHLYKLAGRILDKEGKVTVMPFDVFAECDPVSSNGKLREKLMEIGKSGICEEYKIYDDGGYLYYVFCTVEKYIIWGPVILEEISKFEKKLYGKKNGVTGKICIVSINDIRKVEEIVSFAHGLLFEEYEKTVEIEYIKNEQKSQSKLMSDLSEYSLQNSEWGREHYSFEKEDQMWKMIMNGEELSEFHKKSKIIVDDIINGIGVMSESQKKEAEYKIVSAITLVTRYAIMSGVDDSAAYALSDVSLQKLSKAKNVLEMEDVFKQAMLKFIELNQISRKKGGIYSRYIEQVREYIAKHVYRKISIAQIADEIGLHPNYLSKIFSEEMGMTMMEYIMQEKIRISCNLLKYSDRSIAEIAEYISLAPQSYFTRVFKNIKGETPAKYRKTHFDINFIE